MNAESNYVTYLEALVLSLLNERKQAGDINGVDFTGDRVTYSPYNAIEYIEGKTALDLPRVHHILPRLGLIRSQYRNRTPVTFASQAHWRCECGFLNALDASWLGKEIECASCHTEQIIALPA